LDYFFISNLQIDKNYKNSLTFRISEFIMISLLLIKKELLKNWITYPKVLYNFVIKKEIFLWRIT